MRPGTAASSSTVHKDTPSDREATEWQCSGTHRLSERALRALLAQPSLRELRVMAPGVRLSDEGMAALFTEARRGTLTHAHIGNDAPANALLTRGEVALALEWASPAVCAHLAACPCLERVTIDTDLPSLRVNCHALVPLPRARDN